MLMAVKRNRTVCGRRGLGRYPRLRLTSSLLRCECARGGAAAGWIEKVSECRETAGVGRGARCKKFSPSCFSFYAYGSKKKRNCVRQARARSISHTSTHIFTAAVCARGGAAAGWIEKVSECREAAGVQRRALQCLWLGCWRSVRETS